MKNSEKKAHSMIEEMGGTIRTKDALNQGIHRRTLYHLRDEGLLTELSRGVYRITNAPISNPDLLTIGTRVPQAVICLISALSFHNITTQIPHQIYIAIAKDSTPPKIDNPPLSVHKFSGEALTAGIEEHQIDGVPVKIYSIEKTLADCFKYRNKIGLDVCIEALKLYKSRKKINIQEIIKYAKICRVYKIMTPHLESIL